MNTTVIGIRVEEHFKEKLQKLADNAGLSLSAYASEKLEDAISEAERIDLLVRNMHEEVLTLGDMLSLMMGFNTEVYATMISRISVDMTDAQLKASKQKNEGANVWIGECPVFEAEGSR